jgi:ABC-type branched-subunit amino acid transport system substrate-binding protein
MVTWVAESGSLRKFNYTNMSQKTKIIIGIVAVIAVVLILGLKGRGDGRNEIEQTGQGEQLKEKIKVGMIVPISGPVADYGEQIKNGAVDGAAPGVELVIEDEKCDPKEAVSAFQKLTGFQNIKFILGPVCGSPQEALVPLLTGKDIISVVSAAASSDLYAQSGNNFFNVQYSLQDESKFIADKMYEMGYRNVALVSYGTAFSQTHADSFRAHFKGTIAVDTMITDPMSDPSTEMAKISKTNVDALYSPDISLFFANGLIKLRQYKVDIPVFSTYVVELPAVRALVPDVYYSFPGDLTESQGAVYELSKQASKLLTSEVVNCEGDFTCVKNNLVSSGVFDENGVYKRSMILKQIKNGEPVVVK